ncbi:hypothetical protein Hanom_Chr17g01528141 [Helianthus anomalus]
MKELRKKARVVPDRKQTTTKVKLFEGWHYLYRTHLCCTLPRRS